VSARRKIFLAGWAAALALGTSSAQPQRVPRGAAGSGYGEDDLPPTGHYVRIEAGGYVNEDTVRTARETASHSTGTPEWSNPKGFEKDVFTFARVLFPSVLDPTDAFNYQGRLGWWVDYPDADLNFSFRLQQLTSIRTDPDCRVLKLTDPTLPDYPLIYMEHPEHIRLPENQREILRRYLLNGGVLFINDLWNVRSWEGFESEMRRVLPGRDWTELKPDHPIFHCVFDMKGAMAQWQVPTIHFWNKEHSTNPAVPLQWRDRGPESDQMHVRAWFDDKGRIMIIAIHNSDVSDGWEREGEDDDYFRTFSEKIAYPLGVNIIFYLMTH
jgi:uncharacterized protein DUF4159